MKVVFDNIIFYLQKSGGGSVYWSEIIRRANVDNIIEPVFSEPKATSQNRIRNSLKVTVSLIEKIPLLFLRLMNFTIQIKEKAIFHSSYYRISKSPNAINVITIHDFTSELFFKGLRKFIHTKRKWIGIKNSDGIICISENTKADLLTFYPNINENKIKVIYNGVSDEFFPVSKTSVAIDDYHAVIKLKYVLYIGHRTIYKNFMTAAASVALLKNNSTLLIIGEVLTQSEKDELNKILGNSYVCLSGVDNQTLNIFYNFAFCLIYPSSYEGFGIPIIEAMKAGCPVVTSNRSSIPEVAGDAAIIVEDITGQSFANAIARLDDNDYRQGIVNKGFFQASKFSWEKCFKEIKEFYLALYNNSNK